MIPPINIKRRTIVRGEAVCFAFYHVKIPLDDEDTYKITPTDRVIFTIGRQNRKPVLVKEYPKDFDKELYNSFIIPLSAEESARLECLLYQMKLTIDIGGIGEDVYILVNEELEVVAK
jgi:hypothetical protein